MASLSVYKRNSIYMDITKLIETIGELGLEDTLEKYYDKPVEKETKSIVAGPSFLQFLSNIAKIHIAPGDVIALKYGSNVKFYMLSTTGTWDEILRLS